MMHTKKRAKIIEKMLGKYFPHPPIPLQHKDPFTLLIAVLLSASCTDERVNRTTPHLFKLANTASKMAKVDAKDVEKIIHSLGLSKAKSKNIVALSKMLVEKHQGQVPADLEALEELPGVGHKTASVVMAQAFQKPAFPVDTHIHRLARRWKLTKAKTVQGTERSLKELFPKKLWSLLHLQMIHYARKFCPARGHHIMKCPICETLQAGEKSKK